MAYNFGEADVIDGPYVMFGAGATNYGNVEYRHRQHQHQTGAPSSRAPAALASRSIRSPNVGARFGVRLTPTYIKSDAAGWWCDPFWGCYVVGCAQYRTS